MEDNLNAIVEDLDTVDSYVKQSELNDMKQHADKIIQGIKKLEETDANRAIWELFQNAVDLSPACDVRVVLTDETFEFTHNGEPFTSMTLDCLFKQLSSKTLEEKKAVFKDSDPVGQYGTGFMTSHTFGKELKITGGLKSGDGYIQLGDFLLDRNTENWRVLGQRIGDLKKEVTQLLANGKVLPKPYPLTTFKYITVSNQNKAYADKALSSLRLILPYVMVLNDRLQTVTTVDRKGILTVFKKGDNYETSEIPYTEILINDIPQNVYYIKSHDSKVTVLLPLSKEDTAFDFSGDLPKIFLFYPLIGTENFGINYLFHSRHFQPTEPRNALHLSSDNEDNQAEEKVDQALLIQASDTVFDFVAKQAKRIQNPVKLARINFLTSSGKPHLDKYFGELKSKWVEKFRQFPIVETYSGNITPSEAKFWNVELLKDDTAFADISLLIGKYFPESPKGELVKEWTTIIGEWNLADMKYIGFAELSEKIQVDERLQTVDNTEALKTYYKYILAQERSDLFNAYRLLPNLKGDFKSHSGLNDSVNLPDAMISIADVLMPEVPTRHIHPDFKFNLELVPYRRKNYEADINQVSGAINDHDPSDKLEAKFLAEFINYCKISSSTESTSIPSRMIKLISKYYNEPEDLIYIPALKDDELDQRTPQKRLIRIFLNDLSAKDSEWVIENMEVFKQAIEIGAGYDGYKDMFSTLKIYPNQLHELAVQSKLQIDGNIPDEIKNYYDKIVKPDLPIRSALVNDALKNYILNRVPLVPRDLTEKIESALLDDGQIQKINEHPFKTELLEIIAQVSVNAQWEKFFPLISGKRANLMLEMVEDSNIKKDVFDIVSLDHDKINALGKLARNKNLEEIIRLGEIALVQRQQENANFQHKHTIGTHIEKILRERMTAIIPTAIRADIENVQDGQDIIIFIHEEPVYFLEIKSRWDINSSVRMSRNQTLKAHKEQNRYALCSVNMVKYIGENRYDVKDVELIRDLIFFNEHIGQDVEHLTAILNQSGEQESIRLDGEFRTVIPQWYVEGGKNLLDFELFLIDLLSNIII